MSDAFIASLQIGLPREIPSNDPRDPRGPTWTTAFFKHPITGPVHAGHTLIAGDGQADPTVHGGPDRPILAYAADHYPRWQRELALPELPPPGAFGENFTLAGPLDETTVSIGDRFAVGDTVIVEVSQPRQPCWKLARRWNNKHLPNLVIQHRRGGWYFRVLQPGPVEAGMPLKLIARPTPQWTVARAFELMYDNQADAAAMRDLAAHPALSADWRDYFHSRLIDVA